MKKHRLMQSVFYDSALKIILIEDRMGDLDSREAFLCFRKLHFAFFVYMQHDKGLFKIEHPVAQGLAIGTSAHALGTSRALEIGEVQGAMSSLAIGIAGKPAPEPISRILAPSGRYFERVKLSAK